MSKHMYHLGYSSDDFDGYEPKVALLSGDPGRALAVAKHKGVELVKVLSENRGLNSYLCKMGSVYFVSATSGMGAPSLSIVVNELCQVGIEQIVRVGTCGSINPDVKAGSVVISTAAVSNQGAVKDIAPEGYPCVSDPFLVVELSRSANILGVDHHVGLTCSTDTFFEGQERISSSFNKKLLRSQKGMVEELTSVNVLNFEMEAAMLFAMSQVYGFSAGCVCGVLAERKDGEDLIPEVKFCAVDRAISVALDCVLRWWSDHR